MPGKRDLVGRWVHMFEEDTGQGEVYRRDAVGIPLSRRPRERLEIEGDGTARRLAGGPDDRLEPTPATWSEKKGEIIIRLKEGKGGKAIEYRVVELSADRLVIRP